jgi:hypothetical protein
MRGKIHKALEDCKGGECLLSLETSFSHLCLPFFSTATIVFNAGLDVGCLAFLVFVTSAPAKKKIPIIPTSVGHSMSGTGTA